jgi:hypothetical protein
MKLRALLPYLLMVSLVACGTSPLRQEQPWPTPAAVSAEPSPPLVVLNQDVRQDNIQQTICVPGYTATVRPSTTYTNGIKRKLMREQSLPPESISSMELDHRVPLALGGHPRNEQNLMLQPWEGENGAKKKDRLERKLQILVCAGKVLLDDARRAIFFDWQLAYRTFIAQP